MRRVKQLNIFIFILIGFIVLGVGYAAINNVNLIINGTGSVTATQSNFDVRFLDIDGHRPSILPGSPNTVNVLNDTIATFDVSTLSKKGDTATATIDVENNSNGVGARISLILSSSNSVYFKVTEHINDTELQAGDITTVTITIEMLKTPINNVETTNITAILKADPVDNSTAIGSSSASEVVPGPVSFATDSWSTIKDAVHSGNTSLYNVGDTKEVLIDGNYYTVRIANMETGDHCGINDIGYSQTACGFVVEFVDIITVLQMRSSYTNVGGYPNTIVYQYLGDTLFGKLPLELRNVIEPTKVVSGYGNNGVDSTNFTTLNVSLYLFSSEEIFGSDLGGYGFRDTSYGTSHQLQFYKDRSVSFNSSNRMGLNYGNAKKQYESNYYSWWLRSPWDNSGDAFTCVGDNGNWTGVSGIYSYGVAPAFRIA